MDTTFLAETFKFCAVALYYFKRPLSPRSVSHQPLQPRKEMKNPSAEHSQCSPTAAPTTAENAVPAYWAPVNPHNQSSAIHRYWQTRPSTPRTSPTITARAHNKPVGNSRNLQESSISRANLDQSRAAATQSATNPLNRGTNAHSNPSHQNDASLPPRGPTSPRGASRSRRRPTGSNECRHRSRSLESPHRGQETRKKSTNPARNCRRNRKRPPRSQKIGSSTRSRYSSQSTRRASKRKPNWPGSKWSSSKRRSAKF